MDWVYVFLFCNVEQDGVVGLTLLGQKLSMLGGQLFEGTPIRPQPPPTFFSALFWKFEGPEPFKKTHINPKLKNCTTNEAYKLSYGLP